MGTKLEVNAYKELSQIPLEDLSAKEKILKVAADLFYQHGIHTVGIDRIIADSKVAKMTFYKHFPSKTKLIEEYLEYRNQFWIKVLSDAISLGSRPQEKILSIFDALDTIYKNPEFRGCPFVKGLAEFGAESSAEEVKAKLEEHFNATLAVIEKLVKEMKVKDSKKVAQRIFTLVYGSAVVAQATGKSEIAKINKETARILLEHS